MQSDVFKKAESLQRLYALMKLSLHRSGLCKVKKLDLSLKWQDLEIGKVLHYFQMQYFF